MAALMLIMMLLAVAQPASPQGAQPVGDTSPRQAQPSWSLSDVEEFVNGVKDRLITETEAIQKIASRRLDFVATPENLNRLRRIGASEALLGKIRELAPEPPPKPTASLSLRCGPAECGIKLNGKNAGVTTQGVLTVRGQGLGDTAIDFEKDGYISQQKLVTLVAGANEVPAVALEPSGAFKVKTGQNLLALMRRALGLQTDLKAIKTLSGGGAATSYAGGMQTDRNFDFTTAPPAAVDMTIQTASAGLAYLCQAEKCAETKKSGLPKRGKRFPDAALRDLETELRAFSQYNYASILDRITDPSSHFEALTAYAEGGDEQHLHVETDDSKYEITIGRDLRPSIVTYESKSGLGSGLRISFGDYFKLGDSFYPKRTTIRLPDTGQHGIEIRLDHLIQGPSVTATK